MPRDSFIHRRATIRPAYLLNLILPGTGLILCGREWLGLSFAVLFGIGCNVAIAGWLIAPAAIPGWLSVFAVLLAAATWLVAQVLIRQCWSDGVAAVDAHDHKRDSSSSDVA